MINIKDKYTGIKSFKEGFALVRAEGEYELDVYGFIDENGNEMTPLKYDFASSFKNKIAEIEIDNQFGFVDKQFNEYFFVNGKNVGSEGSVIYYMKYENTIVFKIVTYLPILTISDYFGTKENIINDIKKNLGESQYAEEYITGIEEIEKELLYN